MPKVSICVPTYNNIDCIRQLLPTVMMQTFTDYELIITDDSTNCEIEDYISKSRMEGIVYVHNEKPLGHIYNWNKAISLAAGQYIKIIFSDDYFTYRDSLEKYVALLDENPQSSFAFSSSMQVRPEGTFSREIPDYFIRDLKEDYRNLFLGNLAGAPSGTIFRNQGFYFDEKSNWASDVLLYLTILRENPQFAYSQEPLISIVEHDDQYTHKFSAYDERKFIEARYMFEQFRFEENNKCRQYFLTEYIIKFKKNKKLAVQMGYSAKEYFLARREYLWKYVILEYGRVLRNKFIR